MAEQKVIHGDALDILKTLPDSYIDVIVTSPPYNIKIPYNTYKDDRKYEEYLSWCFDWGKEIERVMSADGSFFLNVGDSPKNPWLTTDVSNVMRKLFKLQNRIYWLKSICINDTSYGHYKPLNSNRFIHNTVEMVFHFTKAADVKLERNAIGVPYKYKCNIKRFNHESDVRCRGNTWFMPYDTTNKKKKHPATFPLKLPEYCIKLHGLREDLVVLDPFSGIGTTLMVCKLLNINGIGIELDELYVQETEAHLSDSIYIEKERTAEENEYYNLF